MGVSFRGDLINLEPSNCGILEDSLAETFFLTGSLDGVGSLDVGLGAELLGLLAEILDPIIMLGVPCLSVLPLSVLRCS